MEIDKALEDIIHQIDQQFRYGLKKYQDLTES